MAGNFMTNSANITFSRKIFLSGELTTNMTFFPCNFYHSSYPWDAEANNGGDIPPLPNTSSWHSA
jgi:hypothetical protein